MSRIIGLDLGTKSLGIAISNSELTLALPYENFMFPVHYYKLAREHVIEVCKRENVSEVALGYPLNIDGTIGERALSSIRFKEDLEKESDLHVTLVNEMYTTLDALDELRLLGYKKEQIKAKKDEVAAKYILETFLKQRSK